MNNFTRTSTYFFLLSGFLLFGNHQLLAQCDVPSSLATSNIENNSVTVSWGAALGAETYTVNYRKVGENEFLVATSSSTSVVLNCLFSGTNYEWKVKTMCSGESSNFSQLSNFMTTGTPPPNPPDCEKPTNPASSNVADNTATLSWDAVSEAVKYNVVYRIVGTSQFTSVNTVTNSVDLSGLFSGNNYEWRVRSICDSENTLFSLFTPLNNFTTTGPTVTPPTCNFPLNLVSSNITDNTATISWDPVSGADDYRFLYRNVGASTWTQMSTASTSANLTGLNSGTTYQWKVRTNCSNGVTSLHAPTKTFTTTGTFVCFTPGNLSAKNITETCVDLSWDDIGNVDGYNVNYRPTGTSQWFPASPGVNSVKLTGLVPGTTYDWKVRSLCSSGNSLFSPISNFTTVGDPVPIPSCEPPQTLSESDIMDTEATLNWSAVINATNYDILHRPVGAQSWTTTVVTAPSTSLTLTGLTEGTEYHWKLRVDCDNQLTSIFTTERQFTTTGDPGNPPICNFPSNLVSSGITDTEATLSWDAEANALSYTVVYRISGASSWNTSNVSAPNTSLALSGLVTGTDYQWKVKTHCDNDLVSVFSALRFFTTSGAPGDPDLCNYPSNRQVTNLQTTSATLGWDAEPNAVNYEVLYREVGGTFWTTTITSNATLDVNGLSSSTNYQWKVKTRCASKNSLFSPTQTFTTQSETINARISEVNSGIKTLTAAPNPFNSVANIRFEVINDAHVKLKVYDFTGAHVSDLYDDLAKSGQSYELTLEGRNLSKGIYIYRMELDGSKAVSNKLILER